MAHLWIPARETWTVYPLTDPVVPLEPGLAADAQPAAPADSLAGRVVLRRVEREDGVDAWLVLAPVQARARVNGELLPTGARLLRDRDEVCFRGGPRVCFSTECLARLDAFPGSTRPAFCPRCRQELERGSPAVQCPGCRMWHHQAEGRECWSYATTCAMCDQPTALDSGYRWTPALKEAEA